MSSATASAAALRSNDRLGGTGPPSFRLTLNISEIRNGWL